MPQLMPLYWIISTIMTLLLLLYMLKIYANYYVILNTENILLNKSYEKWYW